MAVDELYLNLVHLVATVALAMVTGIALAMYVWIIPIILLAPSTATKIKQFNYNIALGGRYQQTGSRIIVLLCLVMAYLSYNHSDGAGLSQRWKYYGAVVATLVPIAPYEIYFIFPTNDKLTDWGVKLEHDKQDNFGDGKDAQVDAMLGTWRAWHLGRILAPFTATCILTWTALVT